MPKISIIVPIYNVEKYLARALDSILSQTFGDWEAILVNDGSPDRSAEIAEEYVNRDARFRLIHRENGGLSAARNTGMKHITGEYVMFLDSDDFLHPQAMELCLTAAERDNSDMVAFRYNRAYRVLHFILHFFHYGDIKPHYPKYSNPEYIITNNIFDYATENVKPSNIDARWIVKRCHVWKCMYRNKSIQHIRFIQGINYEDFPWWSEVLLNIKKTTILNLPLYYYYPNPGSYIISANNSHKTNSLRIGIEAACQVYADMPDEIKSKWIKHFLIPFQTKLNRKEAMIARRKTMCVLRTLWN